MKRSIFAVCVTLGVIMIGLTAVGSESTKVESESTYVVNNKRAEEKCQPPSSAQNAS